MASCFRDLSVGFTSSSGTVLVPVAAYFGIENLTDSQTLLMTIQLGDEVILSQPFELSWAAAAAALILANRGGAEIDRQRLNWLVGK